MDDSRMDNRQWMYSGRRSKSDFSDEWLHKTDAFLNHAFGPARRGEMKILCPCSRCGNRRRQDKENMGKHLLNHGFTSDYTRWIYHGEVDHLREEAVRPRLQGFDADAGVADLLDDFQEAQYAAGRTEEEMEKIAKAFYDMMFGTETPS
jgi:hypothetical protein